MLRNCGSATMRKPALVMRLQRSTSSHAVSVVLNPPMRSKTDRFTARLPLPSHGASSRRTGRAIRRIVVNDDDLDQLAGIIVASNAGQAALQSQHVVLDGDDKRDQRLHGHCMSKELATSVANKISRFYTYCGALRMN